MKRQPKKPSVFEDPPKKRGSKKRGLPGGRPPKEICGQLVQKLAGIGCTTAEISGVCNVSKDTIERRFPMQLALGRAQLRESLRRRQVKLALEGDRVMLIWLGKQYLEQKEPEKNVKPGDPLPEPVPDDVPSEELVRILREHVRH
jgi:hypothetical protein